MGYQSIANGNDDYAGYLFANLDLSNGMELWASAQA